MDCRALIAAGKAASAKYQAYVRRRAERQAWFRELCESGMSREKIAEIMGVSDHHVRDHAKHHGFTIPSVRGAS
jgi:hypothetical protein